MNSGRKGVYTFIAVLLSVVAIVGGVSLMQPSSPITAIQPSTPSCAQSFIYPPANQTTLSNGTEITQAATPVFMRARVNDGFMRELCLFFQQHLLGTSVQLHIQLEYE